MNYGKCFCERQFFGKHCYRNWLFSDNNCKNNGMDVVHLKWIPYQLQQCRTDCKGFLLAPTFAQRWTTIDSLLNHGMSCFPRIIRIFPLSVILPREQAKNFHRIVHLAIALIWPQNCNVIRLSAIPWLLVWFTQRPKTNFPKKYLVHFRQHL